MRNQKSQIVNPCSEINFKNTASYADGCPIASDSVTVEVIDIRCGKNLDKVLVCHVPKGNPTKAKKICIDVNDVANHLAHGDYLGHCNSSAAKWSDSSKVAEVKKEVKIIRGEKDRELFFNAFPNPASDYITIAFQLPTTGKTSVEIYSIAGERIFKLFNKEAEAGTEYNLAFNSKVLAAGIYYYRLQTVSGNYTKKLVVIK